MDEEGVAVHGAGDTHIGGRKHNEDIVLIRPDLGLFLLADGAGGQKAGNIASSLAVTTIAHCIEQPTSAAEAPARRDRLGLYAGARRLSAAVHRANNEIMEIAKSSDKRRGMGSTVVAALFDRKNGDLHLAYVGDSRCYRLRAGHLEQLTHDHSLLNDVLELRPGIADERVEQIPHNVITRALGMTDNLRVCVRTHQVYEGDRYLLCSDGLSDVVGAAHLQKALELDMDCEERSVVLLKMALRGSARDNVAVVVIDASPRRAEVAQADQPSGKGQTAQRRRRKHSPMPAMPIPEPEESTPEIVLYGEQDGGTDSSPVVHVVPPDSRSEAVVSTVSSVLQQPSVDGTPAAQLHSSYPPPADSHASQAAPAEGHSSYPPPADSHASYPPAADPGASQAAPAETRACPPPPAATARRTTARGPRPQLENKKHKTPDDGDVASDGV